jgi:co-chaperonin GroES (HSP10)
MIRPLRNDVLFRRFVEETEIGLIILPDIAKRPGTEAEVIAIGPQCEEVAPGDTVIVDLYQGTQLVYGSESYWLVDEDRIGATVA